MKYYKVHQSFSNEIVFNKTYPKFIHLRYLILPPLSLFSYVCIFHVKIKFIMWNLIMCINISHMKYFLNLLCRACVMQQSTQCWGCTGGKCKFVEAWLGDDFTLPSSHWFSISSFLHENFINQVMLSAVFDFWDEVQYIGSVLTYQFFYEKQGKKVSC